MAKSGTLSTAGLKCACAIEQFADTSTLQCIELTLQQEEQTTINNAHTFIKE